jgi:hypothetical protein
MGLIEHWTMSECPDCGVLTCATAEQVQWCDEHCRSDKTVVEVVPADAHARAVSRAETAEAEVERLKRELAFVEAELRHAAAVSLLDDDTIGGR